MAFLASGVRIAAASSGRTRVAPSAGGRRRRPNVARAEKRDDVDATTRPVDRRATHRGRRRVQNHRVRRSKGHVVGQHPIRRGWVHGELRGRLDRHASRHLRRRAIKITATRAGCPVPVGPGRPARVLDRRDPRGTRRRRSRPRGPPRRPPVAADGWEDVGSEWVRALDGVDVRGVTGDARKRKSTSDGRGREGRSRSRKTLGAWPGVVGDGAGGRRDERVVREVRRRVKRGGRDASSLAGDGAT